MKNIKPYLHYYVGQKCLITKSFPDPRFAQAGAEVFIDAVVWNSVMSNDMEVQPILRRLSDMTEDDAKDIWGFLNLNPDFDKTAEFHGGHTRKYYLMRFFTEKINSQWTFDMYCLVVHKLCSMGYWLFGDEAFGTNQIIDQKTIKK